MPGIDEAERALELVDEAWTRFDVEAVITHLSAAIRGFTAADEKCRAAMACVQLGEIFANATRQPHRQPCLVRAGPGGSSGRAPCIEQGWVAVAAMGCDVDDPAGLLAAAELALDRARRFGDVNLETKAMADGGLAHVQAGRVAEGMALLDEAMALACGPADDTATAAKSVCSFFTACYYTADFERAGSWTDLLRRHGLIGYRARSSQCSSPSHCDSVQATLLVELGRWSEAEAVLARAEADFEAAMQAPTGTRTSPSPICASARAASPTPRPCCSARTRRCKPCCPAARLHLARGDHDLARAAARRGCGSSATTGCAPSSCWPCWSTPSWRRASSTRRPRRLPS